MKKENFLAQLLLDGRNKIGLTLRDVEKRTGISNAQVSLLETGISHNPSAKFLFKLIDLYGLDYRDVAKALEKDETI